jgi:hypothetical protein
VWLHIWVLYSVPLIIMSVFDFALSYFILIY